MGISKNILNPSRYPAHVGVSTFLTSRFCNLSILDFLRFSCREVDGRVTLIAYKNKLDNYSTHSIESYDSLLRDEIFRESKGDVLPEMLSFAREQLRYFRKVSLVDVALHKTLQRSVSKIQYAANEVTRVLTIG